MYLSFKLAEEKVVCVTHTYLSIYQKLGKKGGGKNQKDTKYWVGQKVHSGVSVSSYMKNLNKLFGQLNKMVEKINSKHDCNKRKQNKWTDILRSDKNNNKI